MSIRGDFADMLRLNSIRKNLRYSAFRVGLNAIAFSGLNRLLPSAAGRGVIFTLHHVGPDRADDFQPNAILSVTPEFLQQTVETVLQAGLTPVHLHDLPQLLSDKSDNRKFVAFTFDDGYRNNAQLAAPVLRQFGVPFTVFPAIGFINRSRTIWWETAEALLKNTAQIRFDFGRGIETVKTASAGEKYEAFERLGKYVPHCDEDEAVRRIDELAINQCAVDPSAIVERLVLSKAELRAFAADPLVHIGGHTLSHLNLRRVDDERLRHEIEGSTEAIERYVGYRPKSFSYPYGWCSAVGPREINAVAEAGYDVAVTTRPGVLHSNDAMHPTAIRRISLNGNFQKQRYVKALISGLAFKLL